MANKGTHRKILSFPTNASPRSFLAPEPCALLALRLSELGWINTALAGQKVAITNSAFSIFLPRFWRNKAASQIKVFLFLL